jgi:hypothetical protein
MEQLGSHWTAFHEILYLSIFMTRMEKIQVTLKSHMINGTLHEDQYNFFTIFSSVLLRIRNGSDKICRENQKKNTHFTFSNVFFSRKSCLLRDNVEKYCRALQATDDSMEHAQCMLDTYGYKHTLKICKTYSFSTAIMVARTRLNVTLYLH